MKSIWAVACTFLVVAGAFALGGGCASAKSQMKDFGSMDVGEGPGETLIRLTELQKQPQASQGNPSPLKTGSAQTNPKTSLKGSITEEPVSPPPAPVRPESVIVSSSKKPSAPSSLAKPDLAPTPKTTEPQGNSNSPPAVASAAFLPLLPAISLPEAKSESSPTDPMHTTAQPSLVMIRSGGAASSADANYRLGPEDIIFISVWENKELTMEVVVRPDGKISIPLVQDVQAEGLTSGELADVIQQKLVAYIKNPSVSVIVKQVNASKFYVVGYVARPGPYPLRGDVTILQALSLAGGFTQFASPRKIRLVRNYGTRQEVRVLNYYNMIDKGGEGNYLLKPGDTIVVP